MPQNPDQPRRVVILTALPVEYLAVRAHLTDLKEDTHPQGTVYQKGKFSSPGGDWEVLVAEIGQGNPAAAFEAERAINYFQPDAALFVGVAGGLKDVRLGDVVAAPLVRGYERGKVKTQEFQLREDPGKSSYRMVQRAKAEAKKADWLSRLTGPAPLPSPKVLVEPIAAGEKVVASKRSAVYRFLRSACSDAVAVEMEGIGFLTATHANPQVDALVVRGISDLVAKKNAPDEEKRQQTASRHAAAFAFEVLAKFDLPGRKREPGLKAIWSLPHRRNTNFTGRQELLEGLHQALSYGQPAALTQAIHGLGGVGKTQLAVEYAYRHGPEYSLVWWLRSEEPVALAADYAGLARELDLKEKDAPDQRLVTAAVRRWLAQHGGWLLIFDNAPAPGEVAGYLPGEVLGHVLITSRNPEWGSLAAPLQVPVLPREEAVDFLLHRTGQTDRDAAAQVAAALGDLPLALEQAGAYISETKMPFAKYLKLFQTRREELWGEEKHPLYYEHTVATTWSLALERIKQEAPGAGELLKVCAYLAPDDMPLALFREAKEELPGSVKAIVVDDLAWNRAVAALRRYSLLEVGEEALTMHRLVQQVVQDRLTGRERKKWAGVAVSVVNAAFPFIEVENWPWCARLLPHALTALGHAEALLKKPPATMGRLWNQVGFYLQIRAQFAQAKRAYERALAIDEAAYGPNHPIVARDVNNLGGVLKDLGDLAGARACYERALAIGEATLGPDHPKVAIRVNNLGGVLKDQGDLAGARAAYERALAIDEAVYGPNHPEVATDVNNLGSVLKALGDLAGARAHFERALAIGEATLGPNHPKVAIRVNNLGSVLQALGDPAGARACFERSLAIDEAAYGQNHPTVAILVNNLGRVLQDLGDLTGAKACYERALAIDEAAYGPDHPDVAIDVNNLGGVLGGLGDLDGARACFERALAICKHFLGDDHPDTRLVRRNLKSLG